jgi:sulfatase modifying factor 1
MKDYIVNISGPSSARSRQWRTNPKTLLVRQAAKGAIIMQQKTGLYTISFLGIVIVALAGLMTGCERPDKPELMSKDVSSAPVQSPSLAVADTATDNHQPKTENQSKVVEQQSMKPEDTTTFKKLHIAEIICMSRPDAKRDPNAPEPNINDDWYVKIDGQSGTRYDGISMIAFTPKADRIAYAAREGSKFRLIVDGNAASTEFDDIEDITFSPDGKQFAYGAKIDDKWVAVVDGNAGPRYDFISYFAFGPDGRRFTYAAGKENGKKQTVVLDGVEICPPYDVTWMPVFSNDSKRMAFMAEDNSKRFVVVEGIPDEKYDMVTKPVFSPDSQHYAYFAGKGNYKFLVLDGVAGTPFEDLPKLDIPVLGPNDNRVAYRAQLEGSWFVIVDNNIGPFFDGIVDRSIVLSADGKSHAYAVQKGEQWCVVVNDQAGPLYDGIAVDGPVFSPDGKHFAYGAFNHSKYFVVVDGQPMPGYDNYLDISNNSILFSPDSFHLIYKAKMGTKWHMAVDGRLGPAYDKLPFKPTFTDNAVEYLAQRDGWIFRCKRPFEQSAVEKTVAVNEQRLMLLEDIQNHQRIAYVSDNLMVIARVCPQEKPDNLVFVLGGTFKNTESNYYGKSVPSFYIGKFELTQKEWIEVMGSNPSKFKGDNLPVETISWYDCVEYCNKRSIKEGLRPYYNIDKNNKDLNNKNERDDIKWTVTINSGADGYRLPTEAEWEYAAGGGMNSRSYKYSGSDNIDEVAWYWKNSGDEYQTGFWHRTLIENNHNQTKPVGGRESNELGLYDMSGNVMEWCWDWRQSSGPENSQGRIWKGGGWLGVEYPCELSFRATWEANSKGSDTGFRVCRSK